jgi:hypothetical protein
MKQLAALLLFGLMVFVGVSLFLGSFDPSLWAR